MANNANTYYDSQYLHTVIVKGCLPDMLHNMVECTKDWSAKHGKFGDVLDGEPKLIPDKQPLPRAVSNSDKKSKTAACIIYVNFKEAWPVTHFVQFVKDKAAQHNSPMYCIPQNDAKKSVQTVYPIKIQCDNNTQHPNLQTYFARYGTCYIHYSARNVQHIYINYEDYAHVEDVMYDFSMGTVCPPSMEGKAFAMFRVQISVVMEVLCKMQHEHGEMFTREGMVTRDDIESYLSSCDTRYLLSDVIEMYKPLAKTSYGFEFDEERQCFMNKALDQEVADGIIAQIHPGEREQAVGDVSAEPQEDDAGVPTSECTSKRAWAQVAALNIRQGEAVLSINSIPFTTTTTKDKRNSAATKSCESAVTAKELSPQAAHIQTKVPPPVPLGSSPSSSAPASEALSVNTSAAEECAENDAKEVFARSSGVTGARAATAARGPVVMHTAKPVPGGNQLATSMLAHTIATPMYQMYPMPPMPAMYPFASNTLGMYPMEQQQHIMQQQQFMQQANYTSPPATSGDMVEGPHVAAVMDETVFDRVGRLECLMGTNIQRNGATDMLDLKHRIKCLELECGVHSTNVGYVISRIIFLEQQLGWSGKPAEGGGQEGL